MQSLSTKRTKIVGAVRTVYNFNRFTQQLFKRVKKRRARNRMARRSRQINNGRLSRPSPSFSYFPHCYEY